MSDMYSELAKIVKIVDEYKFVINRGSSDNVKLGANFLVFRLGDNVIDPLTNEDLGKLEEVRGRARVIHVQERMSTLESTETKFIPGTKKKIRRDGGTAFRMLYGGGAQVEEIEDGGKTIRVKIDFEIGDLLRPI